MRYKVYRYVQDLDVDGPIDEVGIREEVPDGEYFAYPTEHGANFLVNGVVFQIQNGSGKIIKV